ncbi:Glycosidase-like protein [Emericellopsis cladophorae]|uniref:Glycosidase-like protein n=1 Tax=Emericellopsis cladophorae TaxID=2686198 RepID=A0A9P9Y075_9HYPO|nr:Glycosidase-like protein [Emericellopsis cladophorae]KAI6781107.1 Glycosidase-like protein [Emericellopsis cladophorae]
MYKYTFPQSTPTKNVRVDVSHVLASYRGQGLEQHFLGGNITVKRDQDWKDSSIPTLARLEQGRAMDGLLLRTIRPTIYKVFLGADFVTDDLVEFGEGPSYESETARVGTVFSFTESSLVLRRRLIHLD